MEIPKFSVPKFLIVIAGPTCSGKSALALKLAMHYRCSIISADSRQIYKELSIGTAKPSQPEKDLVPHYFVDHVSIHEAYSAGHFGSEVKLFLKTYFESNDIIIMCGGTGLYIKSVLEELDDLPSGDPAYAEKLQKMHKDEGISYLQKLLLETDPAYYQTVDLNNPHRIIRALIASRSAGVPYSSLLQKKEKRNLPYQTIGILIHPSRQDLYDQINSRVDKMLESGLENEARALIPFKQLRALQTVGYSELFRYFEGEITQSVAIDEIKKNTRRYAKRQITWFRKHGDWQEFPFPDENLVLSFIQQKISETTHK